MGDPTPRRFPTLRPLVLPALLLLLGWGMWHLSGPASSQARAAPPDPPTRTRAAGELYQRRCQSCHGADGTRDPQRERGLEVPDFTSGKWQARRSDSQLLVSILDGMGTQMPGFGDKISGEQARDLVAFVRSFGPAPTQRAAGPPNDFDKRFEQLEKEFAELRKQFRELSPPPPRP